MSAHISLRLAWYDNSWNGHVCKNLKANTHLCRSTFYRGDLIKESRNIE